MMKRTLSGVAHLERPELAEEGGGCLKRWELFGSRPARSRAETY
jgi:hypothetical protein